MSQIHLGMLGNNNCYVINVRLLSISAVMEETGEKKSAFFLFQSISVAMQWGNATCILGTVPHSDGLDEIFEFITNN